MCRLSLIDGMGSIMGDVRPLQYAEFVLSLLSKAFYFQQYNERNLDDLISSVLSSLLYQLISNSKAKAEHSN